MKLQYTFDELFSDETRRGMKIPASEYKTKGKYPIIDQGKGTIAGYIDDAEGLFTDVPAIIFGDHTRIVKYVDVPFFIGADGVKILSVKRAEDNPKYFYYALKNARIPDTGYNRHFKWLREQRFLRPAIDEQNIIVRRLDAILRLTNNTESQLAKLDTLVKSRFIEMFGDPVTNPMGWEVKTVGENASDIKYGTSAKASDNGKYKYLRMNNLTYDGYLDLSDLKYIDVSDEELEKYVVRKGDVLFNRTNSTELVGKTALFDFDEDMIIAGYIIRVRLNEAVSPVFFTRFMNLEHMKTQLQVMAKGAVNQANINAQEMKEIEIYLPPIALQNQFAAFVQQVDKSKSVLQKLLEKQELLQAALMQEYFG